MEKSVIDIYQDYSLLLKNFNEKGWDLYTRRLGKDTPLDLQTTLSIGPTKKLEEDIRYGVWPNEFRFGDQESLSKILKEKGIEKLECSIDVPAGKALCLFEDDSYEVHRVGKISFIGFELEKDNVKLLAPNKTHIALENFISAVRDSLPDINSLFK